jgi:hypothetical protein
MSEADMPVEDSLLFTLRISVWIDAELSCVGSSGTEFPVHLKTINRLPGGAHAKGGFGQHFLS